MFKEDLTLNNQQWLISLLFSLFEDFTPALADGLSVEYD